MQLQKCESETKQGFANFAQLPATVPKQLLPAFFDSSPARKSGYRNDQKPNDNDSAQRSDNAAALALSSFELLALSFCFRIE